MYPRELQSEWFDRYGKRVENTRLPSKKDERNALAVTVWQDGFGLRQYRYRGLAKTHLQHIMTAAVINLERIYAWLEGIPLAQTRQSHFEQMAHQHLAIA